MVEAKLIETLAQFGFPAVVAFLMIYIMWKLGQKVIEAFDKMYHAHKQDMKILADEHRTERKECYANQEKQIRKFDETIRIVTKSVRN